MLCGGRMVQKCRQQFYWINRIRKKVPFFFWEDHSWETPHEEVVEARKFRELAIGLTIREALRKAEKKKHNHYRGTGHTVIPLAISSGGCLSFLFRNTINEMCVTMEPNGRDIAKQARFVKRLLGRLSVICFRTLVRLAYHQSPQSRDNR